MASPLEKLATSLEKLKELQDKGVIAVRSADLTRTHRERLIEHGYLQEVMKGWYIPTRPDENVGETTAWYTSFWDFCKAYLTTRFGEDWCLSPEQSLLIHANCTHIPKQLLVRSPKARNKITELPHNTSLLDVRTNLPKEKELVIKNGLHLFSMQSALVLCSPTYFQQYPTELRTALTMIKDASEILPLLLEGGHSKVAGRLAGAFRNIGRDKIADDIINTMKSAGFDIRESDPFAEKLELVCLSRHDSPHSAKIKLMWQSMRNDIIDRFPKPPKAISVENYLSKVDDLYTSDAYHSLSIEGYRVTPDLIERIRKGKWNPDKIDVDQQQRDAMAARGYWQAFQEVRKTLQKCLKGKNPGKEAGHDHGNWYRELFAPSITAGLLDIADLAGYRNTPVYIRHSMHLPPLPEAVRDAMPTLFELLEEETHPGVRIVLGHFIFVYIHPYVDGNGRIGRFLMNVMMAAGGYPWTIIPVERREDYMAALETASTDLNITPFTDFIIEIMLSKY